MDEERQTECVIPQNYKGVTNLLSFTFKTRNLIEGIIIGAILALIGGSITVYYEYGFTVNVVTVSIICFGLGAIVGIIGFNDESISEFIIHFFQYLKGRRVTYYNPKVKRNVKPLITKDGTEQSSENMLPRDKIIAIAKKVMEPIKNKRGETKLNQDVFDEELYEFYDDGTTDVEEKTENQSALSRWKHNRQVKKAEKARKKMERKMKKNGKKTRRKAAGAR